MLGWTTIGLLAWAFLSLGAGIVWARYRRAPRRPAVADLERICAREIEDAAATYGDVPNVERAP